MNTIILTMNRFYEIFLKVYFINFFFHNIIMVISTHFLEFKT